jgi:hypothetical protein
VGDRGDAWLLYMHPPQATGALASFLELVVYMSNKSVAYMSKACQLP